MSALILISVLAVVLLYLGFGNNRSLLAPVAIVGLLGALALFVSGWQIESPLLKGMVAFDGYSLSFNSSLILLTVLLFLFGIDYYAKLRENVAEQYALMLFSLVGGLLLTSFSNLLVMFLGIEILSIPLFILAGGKRDSFRSGEAAFKYFLQGSFASGFMLLGIALVYGSSASFDLATVQAFAASAQGNMIFLLGLFFTIAGLAFKVAAVPFHFWSPDVYEGAPTLVTAFMSTVVKTAAFAAFYRLIEHMQLPGAIHTMLMLMTVSTLFLGNIVALRQTQFKRLMAYSSIAHTGFLLLAFLGADPQTPGVLFFYLTTYAIATVGLFVVLTLAKRAANGDEHIHIFRGLFRSAPWLAIATMLLLLSLAGIPLTAGFVAKYRVFVLGLANGYTAITAFAVVMALVGIYYYVMVIREAFTPQERGPQLVVAPLNWLVISFCGIAVVVLGLLPGLIRL
ncbi:MAG: NADH-quinone oxidoreductase subunit N [Flavobacteriales bacterium]|nr:NADH-quinone oxidoreductase subunit N [Flavobacteriales bacterium]MBP7407248.1 NADH-quinone oxidoreductase subunit N [Flavobacteriales bacterium]